MLVVRLVVSPWSMARTFMLGAYPSPLSWSVPSVLDLCLSSSCTFRVVCPSLQALLLTQHYSNSCEYRSITIFQLNENLSGFWLIMSPRFALSSWLQLVYFLCVTRGRRFFFLCSSIYPKLTDYWFIFTFLQASASLWSDPKSKQEASRYAG